MWNLLLTQLNSTWVVTSFYINISKADSFLSIYSLVAFVCNYGRICLAWGAVGVDSNLRWGEDLFHHNNSNLAVKHLTGTLALILLLASTFKRACWCELKNHMNSLVIFTHFVQCWLEDVVEFVRWGRGGVVSNSFHCIKWLQSSIFWPTKLLFVVFFTLYRAQQ